MSTAIHMNFRGFFWILLAVPNGPADILLVLWILLPNGLTDIGDLDPATQWAGGLVPWILVPNGLADRCRES